MTAYIACLLCQHRVRGKPFIIKVGESRIHTTHTPTHSGSPSHPMLQVLMHNAGVRTRALSLGADTLKRCIDYGDRGGARTHDSSLLPRRDNPYATSTDVVVVVVVEIYHHMNRARVVNVISLLILIQWVVVQSMSVLEIHSQRVFPSPRKKLSKC